MENYQTKATALLADFNKAYDELYSENQKALGEQHRVTEQQMRELRSLALEIKEKTDAAHTEIVMKLQNRETEMNLKIDDIDKRIKHLSSQIPLMEKTVEFKNNLENELASLQGELNKLDVFRTDLANLDQEYVRLHGLDEDLNEKIRRFKEEKRYIETLETDFNRLMELSTSMDEKIQEVQQLDDSLQSIHLELRGFRESIDEISTRYDRLDKKNSVLERTMADVDKVFKNLEEVEGRLQACSTEVEAIPNRIEGVRRDVDKLVENSGRISEAMDKLNSLESIINRADEDISKILSVKDGIARSEARLQEVAKVAEEQVNLMHAVVQHDNASAPEKPSDLSTVAKKENVIRLAHRGWSIDEIAKATKLSRSEVELILDMYRPEH